MPYALFQNILYYVCSPVAPGLTMCVQQRHEKNLEGEAPRPGVYVEFVHLRMFL
jgi:hypothetical protein